MMRYLPHTPDDVRDMLSKTGAADLEELFDSVPKGCLRRKDIIMPPPLGEMELNRRMDSLSTEMAVSPEYNIFLGAGRYDHFIPEAVSFLSGRSEFSTAYTPYQPEISQGTLQAVYEYQTLTARLLGMDIANASLYDGASAMAEALLMAIRITRKKKVAVSTLIHPHFRQVVSTYFAASDYEIIELPHLESGLTDLSLVEDLDDLAAVAIQSPNFFGCIENLQEASDKAHNQKALFIAGFTEPIAFGLLKSPGSLGADIVCGEGQSLGIPMSFGGPGLGMLACRREHMRSIPGRLVGETRDKDGKRGYVLTLATREQHIRREKATSNICTNNSLCALRSAIYMALLGGTGIKKMAVLNHDKTEFLKNQLLKSGCEIPFQSPVFNEFVVKFPGSPKKIYAELLAKKIIPGYSLKSHFSGLSGNYLVCVTETKTMEDMLAFAKEVKK